MLPIILVVTLNLALFLRIGVSLCKRLVQQLPNTSTTKANSRDRCRQVLASAACFVVSGKEVGSISNAIVRKEEK